MSDIQFIGGEKGGVGKSVVARLVAQYFIDTSKPFTALDADISHGALMRFYTGYSQAVALSNIDDTDNIVQLAVDAEQTVLVDLPSQSRSALNAWLEENEILSLAEENGFQVTFWHVMDDSMDALNLLKQTVKQASSLANYIIVKNYGRGGDFSSFEGSAIEKEAIGLGAKIISIKGLQPSTMHKIDRLNFSFWAAANNNDPRIGECLRLLERRRVKSWLKDSFKQIESALNATRQKSQSANATETVATVESEVTPA